MFAAHPCYCYNYAAYSEHLRIENEQLRDAHAKLVGDTAPLSVGKLASILDAAFARTREDVLGQVSVEARRAEEAAENLRGRTEAEEKDTATLVEQLRGRAEAAEKETATLAEQLRGRTEAAKEMTTLVEQLRGRAEAAEKEVLDLRARLEEDGGAVANEVRVLRTRVGEVVADLQKARRRAEEAERKKKHSDELLEDLKLKAETEKARRRTNEVAVRDLTARLAAAEGRPRTPEPSDVIASRNEELRAARAEAKKCLSLVARIEHELEVAKVALEDAAIDNAMQQTRAEGAEKNLAETVKQVEHLKKHVVQLTQTNRLNSAHVLYMRHANYVKNLVVGHGSFISDCVRTLVEVCGLVGKDHPAYTAIEMKRAELTYLRMIVIEKTSSKTPEWDEIACSLPICRALFGNGARLAQAVKQFTEAILMLPDTEERAELQRIFALISEQIDVARIEYEVHAESPGGVA